MDDRRLSTADILASGILGRGVPVTNIPTDRETFYPKSSADPAIVDAVNAGKIVEAPNYYGIPHIWKDGELYRGLLLQYCAVTENETFKTAESAAAWFREMHDLTDG